MNEPKTCFRKVDYDLAGLLHFIGIGDIGLPDIQRPFVWPNAKVHDLLDSLYRRYPSGSILVWETEQERPTRDMPVSQGRSPFAGHKLLLAGQQRLKPLTAILKGEPVRVRGRQREIDILFNLAHPDTLAEFTEVTGDEDRPALDDEADDVEQERLRNMTFVVASKALAQRPCWVSVTRVFQSSSDNQLLKEAGVTSFDDPRFAKYSARLKKLRTIRDYLYVIHVLPRNLNYEEAAEIFVRVNSLGVKLRGSDLALAQITARWPDSPALFEQFQDECAEKWMTLDLGLLVRAMVVFATGQSRFNRVGSLAVEKLRDDWEKAKEGLQFAVNFLCTNAGIEDESLLSSPLFFIALAYFGFVKKLRLSQDEEQKLLYWLYIASARGRYSPGSTESLLDADLSTIRRGAGTAGLLEAVRRQFGRLHFEPADFVGRGAGSALFSLVFLALKANGATDWQTGLGLSLSHQGRLHYIQHHHIFPRALLKGRYDRQEINEIANMAFISGRTNRQIRDRKPSEYLPEIIRERGQDALALQAIPLDSSLYEVDNYRAFLEARRQLLAAALNASVKKAGGET